MKRILITGRNSYVGNSFEQWVMNEPEKYIIDKISLRDDSWKEVDFSTYDVVLHVAGIAHVSSDPKKKDLYYKVNRDLTIDIAKKAKAEGVKQFIFTSSIIVYGNGTTSRRVINRNTVPTPSDFYGDSKLQAEEGIKHLGSDSFKIVIVRPPMIYGKDSKGNYPILAKFAKMTPIFPDFQNERSMLHIDNLCEFFKLMIDNEESGLFFPQNKEYVSTSELVKTVAEIHNHKVWMTKAFNPILRAAFKFDIVNKPFGNLVYDKSISEYKKGDYQIRSFYKTIKLTEVQTTTVAYEQFMINYRKAQYYIKKS